VPTTGSWLREVLLTGEADEELTKKMRDMIEHLESQNFNGSNFTGLNDSMLEAFGIADCILRRKLLDAIKHEEQEKGKLFCPACSETPCRCASTTVYRKPPKVHCSQLDSHLTPLRLRY